jgi:hypothetical protein
MKYLAALLFSGLALAQTPPPASQPDCPPVAFNFVGGNGTAPTIPTAYLDNRAAECQTWTVTYEADAGLSGYTVAFQSANGAETPGTWGAYSGNTVNSSASWGTAALGLATYCGLATCSMSGTTVNTPWIRLLVSGATGTGNLRGVFYGYKTGYTGGTGGSGGGGGGGTGCPNPCPIEGLGTAGTAVGGVLTIQGGLNNVPVPVVETPFSTATFTSGQQAVTGTAANLGVAASRSVCVHALITNTINVYAGATGVTTSTGMELPPGSGWCWTVNNTSLIYLVASTTGAGISFTVTD